MGARPRPIAAPTRVVLDTAVVVSALIFDGGRLAWLRRAWRGGIIRPLASKATAAELLRVLAYPKFSLAPKEQRVLQADYLPFCEPVTATVPARSVPRCRDPYDRPFLSLALAGSADFLVSGDDDLLVLAPRFPVPIVKSPELRTALGLSD
ncbi:MAG: putative toxin-antitoxin system toxin component, PIN family [Steroidobacteraceae bacterium]